MNNYLERIAIALERLADRRVPRKNRLVAKRPHKLDIMHESCMTVFKPGERIVYRANLGAPATFYRWRRRGIADGHLVLSGGACYCAHGG